MGQPDIPKAPPPTPPPATSVTAKYAAEGEKKIIKERGGAKSQWLTRGQSLGGGSQLK